jgi:hypothetical protein
MRKILIALALLLLASIHPASAQSGNCGGISGNVGCISQITDGTTAVPNVSKLTVSGATMANNGGGAATLTVTGGGTGCVPTGTSLQVLVMGATSGTCGASSATISSGGLLTLVGGITDTSGTAGSSGGGFSTTGGLTFGGGPISGGGSGGVLNNQISYTMPTSGTQIWNRFMNDTVTVTGSISVIDQGLMLGRTFTGSGTITQEINGIHASLVVGAGTTDTTFMEPFEASASFAGPMNLVFGYLGHNTVTSTGTFTTGIVEWDDTLFMNNSTTNLPLYVRYQCDPPDFSGGSATIANINNDVCVYNGDVNAVEVSLGRVKIGGTGGYGTSTNEFEVDANTGMTYAEVLKNTSGTTIFQVPASGSGATDLQGSLLLGLNSTLGSLIVSSPSGGTITISPPTGVSLSGNLTWPNASSGTILATGSTPVMTTPLTTAAATTVRSGFNLGPASSAPTSPVNGDMWNQGSGGGPYAIFTQVNGVTQQLAATNVAQTISLTQTFSGTLNVTGALQSGGVAGLASKTCTINTANAATGITLTISNGIITGTTTC